MGVTRLTYRRQLGVGGGAGQVTSALSMKMKALVAQSCMTLCDPVDCSPPGSSIRGILQAHMQHQISSKLGKEYFKAVYCHSAY